MAGLDDQEIYETKQGTSLPAERYEEEPADPGYDDYDDGFDELIGEPEETQDGTETPEEEPKGRFRFLSGLSNVSATIIGAVLILVLVYLLVSMIRMVSDDLRQLFSNL